ncbi:MAG: hypothetical protein LC789_00845 [Actinobacteria bacterium]|nr:hypothetical protein [Actinomycetota bacterium]MCA1722442.1 hypothetical protein [Actinomycetota bacterium]
MARTLIRRGVAVAAAAAALLLGTAGPALADFPTVPEATCGPGSLPETGLQGEVPLADQFSTRSMQGYRCNLELVGQYAGDGSAIMMAWQDHCAYMATGYAANDPNFEQKKGVVVIDASDPRHPKETTRLQTPAMINPWEALKANPRSGLLATGEGGSFPLTGPGASGPLFDVYDVKTDCEHPKLQASVALPDGHGHEGDFAPDGRTYYQSTLQSAPSASIVPVDVSDPKQPRQLMAWRSELGPVHALQISEDGNRGYFMVAGLNAGSGDANGLVIVDTSDIQARKPNPQIRVISHVFWQDAGEAQLGRFVRIGGHPYVITTDEFGAAVTPALACSKGQPPYGFVHLVDVADEKRPKVVSTIRMEVNDPANCATTGAEQNALFSLLYSAHYCTPDDPKNTTAIACAWISSGVRVFDVRDPLHPKEIAYYNPPARIDPDSIRGGAPYYDALVGLRTKDSTSTQIRWIRDAATGEQHLWFISGENGFQILRFTNGAYGARPAAVEAPAVPPAAPPGAPAPQARPRSGLAATGGLPLAGLAGAILVLAVIGGSRRWHGGT